MKSANCSGNAKGARSRDEIEAQCAKGARSGDAGKLGGKSGNKKVSLEEEKACGGKGAEWVIVETTDLKKYFPIRGGVFSTIKDYVRAVDGVDVSVRKGETFAIVGESGCGKTTLGRVVMNLIKATGGTMCFMGEDVKEWDKHKMRSMRCHMQMVFQDPVSSLNPRMTVKDIVGEPLTINRIARGEKLETKVLALLKEVGLTEDHLYRYPHEFSGGQRQRIGIARALALNPDFIVLDEPTSALDVSVQAQTLNLLKDLQKKHGLTYMLITHDLSVVRHLAHRVGVMYVGKIVEVALTKPLFEKPLHPYAQALLSAIPIPDPEKRRDRILLSGDVPSPVNPPTGCRFHPRCKYAVDVCSKVEPKMVEIEKEHFVACHLYPEK